MTFTQRSRRSTLRRLMAAAVALALGSTWFVSGQAPASAGSSKATYAHACGKAPHGFARCDSIYRVTPSVRQASPNTLPAGFGPSDLKDAYNLPTSAGVGRVVAIVDAFDLPEAESALATYRSTFGLPACASSSGCFTKMNQDGSTNPADLPASDPGWGIEIALDLEMVSASCPNCAIVLVEANNASVSNLAQAAATGASFGEVVSNSYGAQEISSEASVLDPFYSVPGVVYTASSGDTGCCSGYPAGPQYPAATPDVVAVGGTSLSRDSSARGWTESAWDSGNSGCSAFESKPAWQSDNGCSKRTEVDVSAVADPNTGVATFGPFGGIGSDSWSIVGGTSASAPLVAGAYALAGGPPVKKASRLPYIRLGAHLNDVTSGQNKSTCGDVGDPDPPYICKAQAGYDGPTGKGTPNGVADFRSIAGVSDFDAVGNTELAVYRPSNHTWYVRGSNFYPVPWGTSGDIPVPADYFGDSFTDAAVYRPSTHRWYVQFLNGTPPTWGVNGDIPVPGDYTGDGPADLAVYRPSTHTWYVRNLVTNASSAIPWGASKDTPVPGDYNGDGRTDVATYRPSTHTWYIKGTPAAVWGKTGDVPVPGDYNGDGVQDIAVYRPSTHTWYVRGITTVVWGGSNDAPQPGDYNGDGQTDFATWRPSNGTWYVKGVLSTAWGHSTDIPLVLPYAINRTR